MPVDYRKLMTDEQLRAFILIKLAKQIRESYQEVSKDSEKDAE